jgi:hypothetical protein
MHYTKVHEQQQMPSQSRRADDDSQSDGDENSMDTPLPPFATDLVPHIERLRGLDHDDVVKRTVKYLQVCPNPQLFDAVVHAAPDEVIATICNAAYNVHEGDVALPEAHKNLFRAYRPVFLELTSPTTSMERKRKVIESQSGGFPFLPMLIGSALSALGSWLFGGSSPNQQQQQQQQQ